MAEDIKARLSFGATAAEQAAIDEGLRAYMLKVYNYMASGVALSGIVAALMASSPSLMQAIYGTGLHWVVMLAPCSPNLSKSTRPHTASLLPKASSTGSPY